MTVNGVREKIHQFIRKQFPQARKREIGNDDPLLGSGLVDSLGVLEVVAFLEDEFGLAVTDEELLPENFRSIAGLAAFVKDKLNGTPAQQSQE